MTTLERPNGKAPGAATGHAMILNEYGWLWLNRDGSPTELTKKLYPRLLGENATAEDRFAMNAYLLGGITEFWRAYRQHAGMLHFVYLTSSDPLGYTADHFRDVEKLELDPHFKDYLSNAFAPLGVYLSFWRPTMQAGSTASLQVTMVNDEPRQVEGSLTLSLVSEGGEAVVRKSVPFAVGSLGQETYAVDFSVPRVAGKFQLRAVAESKDKGVGSPVQSRRNMTVVAPRVDGTVRGGGLR